MVLRRFLVTLEGQMSVISSSSFPLLLRTRPLQLCFCSLFVLEWLLCSSRCSIMVTLQGSMVPLHSPALLVALQIKAFGWAGLLCALVSLANINSADMDAKAYMSSVS